MRNTPCGQVDDTLHVFVHLICYIVRYFTQKRTWFSLTMIENTQPNMKGNTFKHCNWWPRPKYQMFCTEDFCSICCPTSMFITNISFKGSQAIFGRMLCPRYVLFTSVYLLRLHLDLSVFISSITRCYAD